MKHNFSAKSVPLIKDQILVNTWKIYSNNRQDIKIEEVKTKYWINFVKSKIYWIEKEIWIKINKKNSVKSSFFHQTVYS